MNIIEKIKILLKNNDVDVDSVYTLVHQLENAIETIKFYANKEKYNDGGLLARQTLGTLLGEEVDKFNV